MRPTPSTKFQTIKEEYSAPNMGKITKEGRRINFKFEFNVPLEEFDSMEEAKESFLRYHSRIQKIIDNYFYLFIRSNMLKRSQSLKKVTGKEVVKIKELLKKLGYVDNE